MAQGRFFPVVGFHLGTAATIRQVSVTSVGGDGGATSGVGPYAGNLGQIFEDAGRCYRFVKLDVVDVACIDGGVAYWETMSSFLASVDASDTEAGADGVIGGTHVAISTSATNSYIMVQCGGDQAAVVVAASTVAGDHMTGHASTDNVLTRTAAGTAAIDKQCATALSTRGTTTSDVGASVANSSKVRWILGNLL